jgi:hypothetical protein
MHLLTLTLILPYGYKANCHCSKWKLKAGVQLPKTAQQINQSIAPVIIIVCNHVQGKIAGKVNFSLQSLNTKFFCDLNEH